MNNSRTGSDKMMRYGIQFVTDWIRRTGRNPFRFQRSVWKAITAGESGILHSPTGTGKTLAIWLGALADWYNGFERGELEHRVRKFSQAKRVNRNDFEPIQVIWITPLRALAADSVLALREPIQDLQLPWSVELRTSDTSGSTKKKQKENNGDRSSFTAQHTGPVPVSLPSAAPSRSEAALRLGSSTIFARLG